MSEEFKFEIISPDERIYSGDTEEVVLPCFEGQITVLKNHIPLITFLRPGIIQIGKGEKFYAEDGTVEFSDNNLLILTSNAKDLVNFDKTLVNDLLKKAEAELNNTDFTDKDRYILSYKIETLREISQ